MLSVREHRMRSARSDFACFMIIRESASEAEPQPDASYFKHQFEVLGNPQSWQPNLNVADSIRPYDPATNVQTPNSGFTPLTTIQEKPTLTRVAKTPLPSPMYSTSLPGYIYPMSTPIPNPHRFGITGFDLEMSNSMFGFQPGVPNKSLPSNEQPPTFTSSGLQPVQETSKLTDHVETVQPITSPVDKRFTESDLEEVAEITRKRIQRKRKCGTHSITREHYELEKLNPTQPRQYQHNPKSIEIICKGPYVYTNPDSTMYRSRRIVIDICDCRSCQFLNSDICESELMIRAIKRHAYQRAVETSKFCLSLN